MTRCRRARRLTPCARQIANLQRIAAIERAIHIINTSLPTKIDFRGLAVAVATRIGKTPVVH